MSVHEVLEAASRKRVLFMGESITDVYHYGPIIGLSRKAQVICMRHESSETFHGGVTAAARHAEEFCAEVHTFSTHRLRKERYLESSYNRKLFEVYCGAETLEDVFPLISSYDVVAVTDYGHGMMNGDLIEALCRDARFLAVNVQSNAGNYGYNLATKYPRADYLCVDEPEARLATQNQRGPIERSAEQLGARAALVVITLGAAGALAWCDGELTRVPAFQGQVVDTLGAGDAFFATTALMVGAPLTELLSIGNAAGKIKALTVGHRRPVTKAALTAYLADAR